MTSTTTMKGILVEKTGGVEVLQYKTDLPVPVPGEGEILVKNEFIGVNFNDIYFRTGVYPSPKPEIPGCEAEGTVVSTASTGELYDLHVGDRVAWLHKGAYAEYTAVPAATAVRVPDTLPAGTGASALLQGLTALTISRNSYTVKGGDTILIHAAAAGVGHILCQLMRTRTMVIATASTPSKIQLAKDNGANFVINYASEDWVARVKEFTMGRGVDVIFDGVGAATFEGDLEALTMGGSLVLFGNASGGVIPPFDISRLSPKNIKICKPVILNYLPFREEFEDHSIWLFGDITRRDLKIKVYKEYPLAEVAEAHRDLEGRRSTGKLLLKP